MKEAIISVGGIPLYTLAQTMQTVLSRGVFLQEPLTSASWDGDSFSTTAKTAIDLSVVFGAPANIKAISASVHCRDSASGGTDCYLILSPNDTAGSGEYFSPYGRANDTWDRQGRVVPCDSSGDIYYQIVASGANTFDVVLEIWGYFI